MAVFVFLVSCQDINRAPKPENLLSEERMVDVLTELAILHGARSYNKSLMEEKGIDPYPYLVEKYGVDSSRLAQSNQYYSQNYKQYQRIYDRVKLRLEALVEEYDSIRDSETKRKDTLRTTPRDSIRQRNFRNDSLPPVSRRIRKEIPAPVSKSRIQE